MVFILFLKSIINTLKEIFLKFNLKSIKFILYTVTFTLFLIQFTNAVAQTETLHCQQGTSGPIPGSNITYSLGMCDVAVLGSAEAIAHAVSGSGKFVVGEYVEFRDGSNDRIAAFYWTSEGGAVRLDPLSPMSPSYTAIARSVSFHGDIIVGESTNLAGTRRPVRWKDSIIEDLGTLRGINDEFHGVATGVNRLGNVVVGTAQFDDNSSHAFRWTEGGSNGPTVNPQMEDLGTLFATDTGSEAFGVNSLGNVVVGTSTQSTGLIRAFRWIEGRFDGPAHNPQMEDLGDLTATQTGLSGATAVNHDGKVVVGLASNDHGDIRAFRWVEGGANGHAINPQMEDLGVLQITDSLSAATAVSADGRVVVGFSGVDSDETRAFRWVENSNTGSDSNPEMQDLGSLRADQSGSSRATGVSADGSIVVGVAQSDSSDLRPFIWRTQMQDFENLIGSFPILANDTQIAVAQQQYVVGRMMDETCLAGVGQSCLRVGGWRSNTAGIGAQDIGSRTSGAGTLTYGRGLDGQITIGGTLSVNSTSLNGNGFDMGAGLWASLWTEYSQGGLARTGWQAGAATGWGRESGGITRGRGLDNVMLATGDSSLQTFGARATLGYGFEHQDWLVTPSATLAYFRSNRSAYIEQGSDFNASYEMLELKRITATLSIKAETQVGINGKLAIEAGLENDLHADRIILTGSTKIPGLNRFSFEKAVERRKRRGFLSIGYTHNFSDTRHVSGIIGINQQTFVAKPKISIGLSYGIRL